MFIETTIEALRRATGADEGENIMPQTTKDENDPKRLVKIKFIRNTAEGGEDYGPDYPKKVAEVPFHRAAAYIRQGRAEAVSKDDELKEIEESAIASGQLSEEKAATKNKK